MTIKIAIIGAGSIAEHLQKRLKEMGHTVCWQLRRETYEIEKIVYNREQMTLRQLFEEAEFCVPQVVCIAISTLDKGESARDYIMDCARAGVSQIVTCEKGSLAFHAKELAPYFANEDFELNSTSLKFNATVTGGVQSLSYLRSRRLQKRIANVQAVLNGTLNFVFDMVERGGRSLGEACGEASRLGYAEPGATDALTLINGEMRDVVMKTCVLFNTTLARRNFLTPEMLGDFQLTTTQLEELSEEAMNYRLVVSFSNQPVFREHVFLEGNFATRIDGWHIQGGFRNTRGDAELLSWLPGGVGNAVHIVEGNFGLGGKYTLTGPGAGHEATTTAMLNDFLSA